MFHDISKTQILVATKYCVLCVFHPPKRCPVLPFLIIYKHGVYCMIMLIIYELVQHDRVVFLL